jgi:hypothetical protein
MQYEREDAVAAQTSDSCRSRRSADIPDLEEDGTAWFEPDNKLEAGFPFKCAAIAGRIERLKSFSKDSVASHPA